MNSLIEWVNRAGELWLAHAVNVSWQIAILSTAFLLLDRWLARRVRAVVRHAWWCLVLLKLVLPPNFASPTSAGYWLHTTQVEEARPLSMAPSPDEGGVSRAVPAPSPAPNLYRLFTGAAPGQPDRWTPLSWEGGLYLLWLAGVAGLASTLIRRARRVSRLVRGAAPADPEHVELLRGAAAELGLKRLPRLLIADGLGSPAVCGLWRPAIVLPPRLVTELGTTGLRAVLLHELAHVRRGDLWVNFFQAALQALYWWHPLVWVANSRMRAVREEATDEMVVVAQRGEVENYAQTLVTVARSALRAPTLSLGLVGIMESRRALKSRVERLLSMAIPRNSRLGWAGWCSLPLLAAALLPMAPRPAVAAASTPVGSTPAASPFGKESTSLVAAPRARVVTPETFSVNFPPPSGVVPRANPGNDALARIRLVGVDFGRWTLEQVARYLTDESRRCDPLGRGVQFVVNSGTIGRRDVRRSTSVNQVARPASGPAGEFTDAVTSELRTPNPAPPTVDPGAAEVDLAQVVVARWDSFLDPNPTLREVVDAVVAGASSPIQAFAGDFRGDAAVVDPTVAEDGYAITMACEGHLTELVDLRAGPAEADRANPTPEEAPVFSVNALGYINHAVNHSVTVYDGQSALVLVPGAEPLPGLGASAKPRRFLLAMSPRLIDPAGNRIHAEGHVPRPVDEVPGASGDAKPGALLRR